MVFIGGPRQVGKTTLSKRILDQAYSSRRYFNWDYNEDRQALLDSKWYDDEGLIVFDELDKYKNWKNWIKGVFDTNEGPAHFLVTGTARIDVMSNIAGEIQVSPKTVNKWLDVLERMYLVFAVRPYTKNLPRAVLNPRKATQIVANLKHPYSSGRINVVDPIIYFRQGLS